MSRDYEDIEPIEIEDVKSSSDKERDRQLEELDTFFAQVDPSLRLMVYRLQPSWCRGCLEEIYVANAREDINLQYFIKHWGGQLLQIRVRGKKGQIEKSYMIPLYSYPPLVKGERITEDDLEKPEKSPEASVPQQSNPLVVNQGSNMEKVFELLPAIIPLWSEYVKHQEARRQSDMAMMLQIAKTQSGGGIADITKIGAVMTQLNQMFRQNNPEMMGDGGELGFMTQALDVIKSVMNRPQIGAPQEITAHRLTGPKGLPNGKETSQDTDGKVTPIIPRGKPQIPQKQTETDYAKTIAEMDAHNAAGIIISAFGNMPEDKREQALGYIMDEYQKMHPEMFVEEEEFEDTGEQRGRK